MEQRWWQRPSDGIVFMVNDPDHIARIVSAGWREVERSDAAPTEPPAPTPPETAEHIKARQATNDAARAAFDPAASAGAAASKRRAKPIRPSDPRQRGGV